MLHGQVFVMLKTHNMYTDFVYQCRSLRYGVQIQCILTCTSESDIFIEVILFYLTSPISLYPLHNGLLEL